MCVCVCVCVTVLGRGIGGRFGGDLVSGAHMLIIVLTKFSFKKEGVRF